jgi:hypothetical protein
MNFSFLYIGGIDMILKDYKNNSNVFFRFKPVYDLNQFIDSNAQLY